MNKVISLANNFDLQVSKIEKNEQIEISKDWLARKQLKFERIISLYVEVIKLEQVKKSSSQRSQVRTSEVEIRAFKHVAVLNFSWAQAVKICVRPSVRQVKSYHTSRR